MQAISTAARGRLQSIALATAALGLGIGSLTACGSTAATDGASATPSDAARSSEPASAGLTVTDAWAKAAESGMTAAFGTLTNNGSAPVTVVSAATDASDRTELHEMVMKDGEMVMQPKVGGFEVPAGGSFELAPGGSHVMIMDVKKAIKPGDTVRVTLTLDTGGPVEFEAVAKDYAGADESYQPEPGEMSSPGGMASSSSMG